MLPGLLALLAVIVLCATDLLGDINPPEIEGWHWHELTLPSSLDDHPQPVLVGVPADYDPHKATPLLVGVHTWSAVYRQYAPLLGPECARRGWLLVLPNFRGPNLTLNPNVCQGGGSLWAQRDVLDAVHYMQAHYQVDPQRIMLTGGSGGGHMSLMMATKYPELWAGVSAWCPITNMAEWHAQANSYAPHIEAVCGGAPGDSETVDFTYLCRSPRTFITNLTATPVFIGHGDKDPTIWVEQTLKTYDTLRPHVHCTELYCWNGGHEMLVEQAVEWLAEQRRPTTPPRELRVVSDEGKWYHWLYVKPARPLTLARAQTLPGDDEVGTLRLLVEDCATVQVRLAAAGPGENPDVAAVGHTMQPGEVTVSDGCLILTPPPSATAEYLIQAAAP